MDAARLQAGFKVGDWLIQPRESRATAPDGRSLELQPDQVQVLLALAERHGEAFERRALRDRIWPHQPGSEDKLRRTVAALRAMFGDSPRAPKCIASVGREAYALVAHFELLPEAPPDPDPDPAPASVPAETSRAQGASSRLHWLLGELRRRSVVKVAASYLVGMWIVLQVAEVTFEPLRFPDWWMSVLTILAVLGLPIVVTLAWMYEITPAGVVIDAGDEQPGVKLPRPRQSLAGAIVAGVALMSGVTGFAWWHSLQREPEPSLQSAAELPADGPPSVAVLPLVDMSPGGGHGYLGDGLSEELSLRLAHVPGLRVAARTSAFEFKGRNIDVRRIGQQLGVNHVLEGSVRREGDTVRVTVQLIDSRNGFHVWAGNFDRAWRDVLSMQDDIARSVTEALQGVLVVGEAQAAASKPAPSVDAAAIEPYLRGLASLRQPADPSRIEQGVTDFEQATAIAPEFAAAHAGLCRALARRFESTRDRQALEQAEIACRRALELDATLVETEEALARLYVADGKFEQAAAAYRRLTLSHPTDADLYIGLGDSLAGLARNDEAEASYRQGVAAEPAYAGARGALAQHLYRLGRVEEMTVELRKVTELVPSSAGAWSNLGAALQLQGDMTGAIAAFERSLQLEPSKNAHSNLATAYFYLGRYDEAVTHSESAVALGPHDMVVRGNLADALWQLQQRREDAVATYRKAIELGERELISTPDDPTLRAQLGYYYGRTGESERSRQYLDAAARTGGDQLYVHYFLGVAAADRGERETALAAVQKLVQLGYPTALLRSAPEFRSLLQDAQYLKIVGGSG